MLWEYESSFVCVAKGDILCMKCPKCGSERVAPILYGMPALNEEIERDLKEEKLFLGGCCVSINNPEFHCFYCGSNVGVPPILITKRGEENYKDVVKSVVFQVGGCHIGYTEVQIRKTKRSIPMNARRKYAYEKEPDLVVTGSLTIGEWNTIMDGLFNKVRIHECDKRYYEDIEDGGWWDLEMKLTGGRERCYGGNVFPHFFNGLYEVFQPYLKEVEFFGREQEIQNTKPEHTDEELFEFLGRKNITYIDKRDKGGALWVIGGHELDQIMLDCRELGFNFSYCARGGKTTKSRPGWYLSGK